MVQIRKSIQFRLGVLVIFTALVSVAFAAPPAAAQTDSGCVIPESGPWPPCATGGGSAPATPPASGGGDCVIPSSGPWPPCATGGGSAPAQPAPAPAPVEDSAEKTRSYGLGEIRAIMIGQLGDAAGDPIDPDECSISINERAEIRLSCRIAETQFGGNIYLVIHVSLSVVSSEPNVTVLSIEFGGQQIDKNDEAELFQSIKDVTEQEMRKQFKADLNYTALISIETEKDTVLVTYR